MVGNFNIFPHVQIVTSLFILGDTSSLSGVSVASTTSMNSLNSTSSMSSSKSAWFYITEQLRFTAERDPLHEMHEDERRLLWSSRYHIVQQVPNLLPKLLLCIEWNDYKETAEMLSLLPKWPKLPPARALELLDFAYADAAVIFLQKKNMHNLKCIFFIYR